VDHPTGRGLCIACNALRMFVIYAITNTISDNRAIVLIKIKGISNQNFVLQVKWNYWMLFCG
jgi:hypothetical protein